MPWWSESFQLDNTLAFLSEAQEQQWFIDTKSQINAVKED